MIQKHRKFLDNFIKSHTNGGLAEGFLGHLVSQVGAHEYRAGNLELLLNDLGYELDVGAVSLSETLKTIRKLICEVLSG